MRILVVEDNSRLAAIVAQLLSEEGHAVESARDGRGALELALAPDAGFDVIVLDVVLPDMDGLEVCRGIRAGCGEVSILMCSARTQIEECLDAFDAGADDYLVKPFALQELRARVHSLGRRGHGGTRALASGYGDGSRASTPRYCETTPEHVAVPRARKVGRHVRRAWTSCTNRLLSRNWRPT
jgi:DNA-binding response OmpR family regulator